MIAVIFDVTPAKGQKDPYLSMAAQMRARPGGLDGVISVERFESLSNPGKLLSLSLWRDVMVAGYRLRVAGVIRDYGMQDRDQARRTAARCTADQNVSRETFGV